MGSEFSYTFAVGETTLGNNYALFYQDEDGNGQRNSGETYRTSPTFRVQQPYEYPIRVDVSDAIPGAASLPIQDRLTAAQNLLLKKDSANDWRAAVKFTAISVTSFTATDVNGDYPDPVPDDDAQRRKHTGRASSDIVFVQQLEGGLAGMTYNDNWGDIIIDWDSGSEAQIAAVIAHEIGHGVGLDHDGHAPPLIMHEGVLVETDNELNQVDADTYD